MAGKAKQQSEGGIPKGAGNPATNALASIGITTLEQVAEMSEEQLKNLHGVGPKAIKVLRDALAEKKLAFKPNSDFPKLAAPAVRALTDAGIIRLDQLTGYTEAEIAALHGISQDALDALRSALDAKGLSFKA